MVIAGRAMLGYQLKAVLRTSGKSGGIARGIRGELPLYVAECRSAALMRELQHLGRCEQDAENAAGTAFSSLTLSVVKSTVKMHLFNERLQLISPNLNVCENAISRSVIKKMF